MSLEIEAKLKVESHEAVRAAIVAAGGVRLGRWIETNRIYDRPDGFLRARGRALRVRSAVDEAGRFRGATVTVKGPPLSGPLKSREEIELRAAAPEDGERLAALLGFGETLRFTKRRESWTLGECRVELDTVPFLGAFVEVEGPSAAAVEAVRSRLGLADAPHVPTSYVGLLAAYCHAHGIDTTRIEFGPPAAAEG